MKIGEQLSLMLETFGKHKVFLKMNRLSYKCEPIDGTTQWKNSYGIAPGRLMKPVCVC